MLPIGSRTCLRAAAASAGAVIELRLMLRVLLLGRRREMVGFTATAGL